MKEIKTQTELEAELIKEFHILEQSSAFTMGMLVGNTLCEHCIFNALTALESDKVCTRLVEKMDEVKAKDMKPSEMITLLCELLGVSSTHNTETEQ